MKLRRVIPVKAGIQFLMLALVFATATASAAGAKDPLQRFVDKVETLSANFEQVQKDEAGKVTQTSSGKLWLSRPGKFRWSYEKPYEQLISCDGKTLWMYDPDLSQVTVRPAGASLQGTPVQLLTDRAALEKQFKVEDLGAQGVLRKLRLTPLAPDSDFKAVEMSLTDGVPQRLAFYDQLGGSSEVSFTAIRLNQKFPDNLFVFAIPEGTEVIQAPAAAPHAVPPGPGKK